MKAPDWRQNVLLVSGDSELQSLIRPAFGQETVFECATTAAAAIARIEGEKLHVLIVDANTTDEKLLYFEEKESTSFLELAQYSSQMHPGILIVAIVNKLPANASDFAKKSGVALIMDRKAIALNRMIYLIRALRLRTFRTALGRDLEENIAYPVDLFHYLPMNQRYAVFLPKGEPFTEERRSRLLESNVRHLFVREPEFETFLKFMRKEGVFSLSEELSITRNRYRQLLISAYDMTTDGMLKEGHELYARTGAIVDRIADLSARFPNLPTALSELPYPRGSVLAAGLNSALYALAFSGFFSVTREKDVAIGLLLRNLGQSEIDQERLLLGEEDERAYPHTIALLRRKQFPLNPTIERVILESGESFLWSQDVQLVPSPELKLARFAARFQALHTVYPGKEPLSAEAVWNSLGMRVPLASLLNPSDVPGSQRSGREDRENH